MSNGKASELAGRLGHGRATVHGVYLETRLQEGQRVAAAAAAEVEHAPALGQHVGELALEAAELDVGGAGYEGLCVAVVIADGLFRGVHCPSCLERGRLALLGLPALARQILGCHLINLLEEVPALCRRGARLGDERFPQRVVAGDEVLVPGVEAQEVVCRGDAGELALLAAVALGAREHEVPHAVPAELGHLLGQGVREEVVDVAGGGLALAREDEAAGGCPFVAACDADGRVAVEAVPLLVAVERAARGGDGLSAGARLGDELLAGLVVGDAQQACRYALLPGGFHQVPAGLGLLQDAGGLGRAGEPERIVGEDEALGPAAEVLLEELDGHRGAVDVVEGVEHVVEAVSHGGVDELAFGHRALVEAGAGLEELVGAVGGLARGGLGVAADVLGVGQGEVFQGDA